MPSGVVELAIRPGEILGPAGIAGNGQSEFMRALAGLESATGDAELGAVVLSFRPEVGIRARASP